MANKEKLIKDRSNLISEICKIKRTAKGSYSNESFAKIAQINDDIDQLDKELYNHGVDDHHVVVNTPRYSPLILREIEESLKQCRDSGQKPLVTFSNPLPAEIETELQLKGLIS